jgi:hypothetical protein
MVESVQQLRHQAAALSRHIESLQQSATATGACKQCLRSSLHDPRPLDGALAKPSVLTPGNSGWSLMEDDAELEYDPQLTRSLLKVIVSSQLSPPHCIVCLQCG